MTPSDLMLPYVILKRLNKFRKPQIAYVCSLKLTNEIWGLVGYYYVTRSRERKTDHTGGLLPHLPGKYLKKYSLGPI